MKLLLGIFIGDFMSFLVMHVQYAEEEIGQEKKHKTCAEACKSSRRGKIIGITTILIINTEHHQARCWYVYHP